MKKTLSVIAIGLLVCLLALAPLRAGVVQSRRPAAAHG